MNNVKNDTGNGRRRGRVNSTPQCRYYCVDEQSYRIPVLGKYENSIEAFKVDVAGYGKFVTAGYANYDPNISYTTRVNDWCYANGLLHEKITQQQGGESGRREWYYERSLFIMERVLKAVGIGRSISRAKEMCNYSLYLDIIQPRVQMESENPKESEQGLAIQESDKSSNTIITRDEGEQSTFVTTGSDIINIVSSEPVETFAQCVGRWMPLTTLEVTTAGKIEDFVATYYLPETLFQQMCKSINLLPFEAFIYSELSIEMRFVTNANKFHCGKLLVSVKFDSYQADSLQNTLQAGLSRPHAIIDLASNNEVTVKVPFRYHRALMRNVKNDSSSVGIRPSKYASVYVQILSPLRTGAGGATEMNVRPFARFVKAKFAGMSYRVKVQMDTVGALMNALPSKELKVVLGGAEKLLRGLGSTDNRDKPTTLKSIINIPRPKLNFGTGKGLMDVVPLKNNPYSMTSYHCVHPYVDDPKTVLDIAHIWGLRSAFVWKAGMKPSGDFLGSFVVDPTCRKYNAEYDGVPTPLEYVCAMYNFWSGPIEMRLDFVSNSFHTGAIMVSIEFGRPAEGSGNSQKCDAASTYTKTFHLGEQKSFSFTVPYIYDTVWRRTAGLPYNPMLNAPLGTDEIRKNSLVVYPESKTIVNIQIINELRPVSSAPQEIDVLLFWRGGKNFMVHGLKQSSFVHTNVNVIMDNFPADSYAPEEPKQTNEVGRKRRDVSEHPHKFLPTDVANQWNEYKETNVRVQMDTGEKEDKDPTLDFGSGRFNLDVQTNDSQVSIKDIMRRPVLLIHRATVNPTSAGNTGYFIPIMPPSAAMQFNKDVKQEWSQLVGVSPQAHLANLFRFWRGCNRYTIIVEESAGDKFTNGKYGATVNVPIYVTYVPHTGTRLIGNRSLYAGAQDANAARPIYASGLTTEFIIPRINPVVTVETPYDTENCWTLMFDEDGQRNYSWRDKGDTNCGHLVISTRSECIVTVWWSAGDDFELANFYGPVKGYSKESEYSFPDRHARVQMDFQPNDDSYLRRAVSMGKYLWPTMLTAVPVVGPPLATGVAISRAVSISNKVEELANQWTSVGANANSTMGKINEQVDNVANAVEILSQQVKHILEKLTSRVPNLQRIQNIVQDVVIDVFVAWFSNSWVAIGAGIVRLVSKIFNTDKLYSFISKIASAISNLVQGSVTVQSDRNDVTLVGVLAAMIGTIAGVMLDTNKYTSRFQLLITRFTTAQGVAYMNQVLQFVMKTFECIKLMIMDVLGLVDPSVKSLQLLSSNSAIIQEFVLSAQTCLNEANAHLFNDARFRLKFWTTVLRAYQIQHAVVSVRIENPGLPTLLKLTGDIIKKGTEKFVDLSCSPVRYEPFVICIVGESNIGKSYCSKEMVNQLLDYVGLRNEGETIYTRMPGSKFWNGYRGHQCVVYDDWLNIVDPQIVTQQLNELYMLKSTCEFIPEMADLADKKVKANPLIVLQLCNDAFPSCVSNVANHKDAVFRRRDIVLEARVKEEYKGIAPREYRERGISIGQQFEFTMWKDSSCQESKSSVYQDYSVTLEYLKKRYKRYHQQETINVKQRMQSLRVGFENATQGEIADPFELFYATQLRTVNVAQTGWLPSEQLAQSINEIIANVERAPIDAIVTVSEEPENVFQAPVDVVSGAVGVFLLSPHFVVRMSNWGWNKVQTYLDKILSQMSILKGRCNVCFVEDKILQYGCRQAGELHAVCAECYLGMNQHSNVVTCPVCRDPHMDVILHGSTGGLYLAIKWVLEKGRQFLTPLLNYLNKMASSYPCKIFQILRIIKNLLYPTSENFGMAMGSGIVLASEMYFSPHSIGTEASMATYTTVQNSSIAMEIGSRVSELLTDNTNNIVVQMDSDWPEVEPLQEVVTEEEPNVLLNVRINEDILEDYMTRQVKLVATCLHSQLIENVHAAVYERRNYSDNNIWMWRIPVVDGIHTTMTYVEDGFCCDECPFKIVENVREFYAKWMEQHRSRIIEKYVAVHNNVVRREHVIESIPRLLRPNWMAGSIILLAPSWWEYLTEKFDNYKSMLTVCSLVVATLGGVYGLTRVFNNVTSPQSDMNYNSGEIRQLRRLNRSVRIQRREIVPQAEELSNVVAEQIARNYILIKIWEDDKIEKQLAATGLVSNVCIMPTHYLHVMSKSTKITIEPAMYQNGDSNHMRKVYTYSERDFVVMANTDLVFFRLPKSFPLFKNILKFVQREKDLFSYLPSNGTLVLVPTRKRQMIGVRDVDIFGIVQHVKVEDVDGSVMVANDVVKYNHSESGACSSLLITNGQRPIRSMHFAGSDVNEGYGILLTVESIEEVIGSTIKLQYENTEFESLEEREDAAVFDMETVVDYLGALPKGRVPFCPKKTKIERSLVAGNPKTAPAFLSSEDKNYKSLQYERSPLWYGCRKHGKVTKDFTPEILNRCAGALSDILLSSVKPLRVNPKRLTVEQAITGFVGLPYYDPMKLDTSAGYPWQLSENTTKSSIIHVERDEHGEIINVKCDESLLEEIKRKESLRKQGIIPTTIFVDTLKDERKLLTKRNKQGGTRVFCASPTDYTISMRQNMLDYSAAFMSARFNAGHAVGINAKGKEWTELFRRLTHISPYNIIMLDYSNFGPAFNSGVAHAAAQVIIEWIVRNVEGVDATELWALMYECLHSVHAMSATVYRQFAGSPSGAAITTIINTHVNELYILIAWSVLCKQKALTFGPDIFAVMRKHVCMVAYGDDLIMSVSDDFKDVFNTLTIQQFFSEYGITATSAEKDNQDVKPFVNIMEAMFLKRKFRKHDMREGYMLAPLDIISVEEIPLWVWKSVNKKASTKINVESALLEAHGHGKDYFEKFKKELNSALASQNIETTTLNWEDLDDLWFEDKMPNSIDVAF